MIIIWGDQNRLLLHDHDGRYSNQSQIPILAQTTVFAENNYLFPDGVITSNQVELFIGGAESEIHANKWLGSHMGIQCHRAGGYVAEYNIRHAPIGQREDLEDFFLLILRDQYADIFEAL